MVGSGMRCRKEKNKAMQQLDLFDNSVFYWYRFKPVADKLLNEIMIGKNQYGGFGDETWWRSRFSDFLTNLNSKPKDADDFLYRHYGYMCWTDLWIKNKNYLTRLKK
jgi:hypothetical protein